MLLICRYQVHQKLVGFMAPIEERGGLSDTARYDAFISNWIEQVINP